MNVQTQAVYEHNGIILEYSRSDELLAQTVINCERERADRLKSVPLPQFQLAIAGVPLRMGPPSLSGVSSLSYEMKLVQVENDTGGVRFHYRHAERRFSVVARMEFMPGAAVIRQTTTFINESDQPMLLTNLSAMHLTGIATDGCRPWQDKRKIKVHHCMQTWHGEGQWRQNDLEELGLYHASVHPPASSIRFSSLGTFSTAKYLPMVVIEDMETSKVWYGQIETSASWNWEIGFRGSWNGIDGSLYLNADGGSERFGGWKKSVLPGDSYTSVPVAFGCVRGDFNDAVRELTAYRRRSLKPANAWEAEFPLVFNDYMNCIWGNPTREKLIPLIDASSKAGAECFCIDAGWFMEHTAAPVQRLGDWLPREERFGEGGLRAVLDYIRSKGMIPGLWLEIEACHVESEVARRPDDWFLYRNGERIGGPDRLFFDFANPEVREYFHRVIDRIAAMGVGYIKNDYNDFIPIADGPDGVSVDGARACMEAFYGFMDEVRAKHPRLIVENCGSGAMREDNGILSHFHVQSTSDQSIYHNYPSIIQGSLAGILPEQAGIWSYPYPALYLDYAEDPQIAERKEYFRRMSDGEQTIFNMVNGLCGNMVLSGRIDQADPVNRRLIREGAELYKCVRDHIHRSYPVFPTGLLRIKNKDAWASLGLINEAKTRMLLAVWRLESQSRYLEIEMKRWIGGDVQVRQLYPSQDPAYDTEMYYNDKLGRLTLCFERPMTARYFEIIGNTPV